MTHYFANVLYLSICMLGNCSCFYFRLMTFFKIKVFLKNKPPRTTIRVSNSLDSDQDGHSVGLHLGSKCLQRAIGQRQNYPLACKELYQVNTLVFNIIVSYRNIHANVYHKYSDTLNTFNMLCPLNKAKVIIKGSS